MIKKEDFNEHEQTVIDLTTRAFDLLKKKTNANLDEIHWLILIHAVRDAFVCGMDVAYDAQSSEEHDLICMSLNKITHVGVFDKAMPVPDDLS